MNDIARALARALVSAFHPRMLWLAVWPFFLALIVWGVIGYAFSTSAIDWITRTSTTSMLGGWVDASFAWFGVSGGVAAVATLIYLGAVFGMMVLTALIIIATVAMPTVVDHIAQREYPTLERKHGGSYVASVVNAVWVGIVFILGFVLTIPLWLIAPLAFLLPLFWWGWATARMFRYDALVEHASADERRALIQRHGKSFLVIGIVVSLLNFIPLMFFVVPILGGLAFTHYGLRALDRLRAERGEADFPLAPAPIGGETA